MVEVTILTHNTRWKGLNPTVKRAAEAALAKAKVKKAAVTLVLTNNAEIKTLNTDFRGKPKATNVLSFPDGTKLDGLKHLGDVVLAYETISAEAKAQGKALKDHLTHLVIHGVLHLLGHDHENEKDANRMEALEINILRGMGIANPYETN